MQEFDDRFGVVGVAEAGEMFDGLTQVRVKC